MAEVPPTVEEIRQALIEAAERVRREAAADAAALAGRADGGLEVAASDLAHAAVGLKVLAEALLHAPPTDTR